MTDVLENSDRAHDLTQVVSYGGGMSTEKDFSRFSNAQFLRNRGITHVFCLQTFFDGMRQILGKMTLVKSVAQKASLGSFQHPARRWIGEDDTTVPVAYQHTVAHAIDDGFDFGLLGGN